MRLKLSIPHAKHDEVYKPQSRFKSFITNKPIYLFERMQGNIELHENEDFTSIKLLNLAQIERLRKKYPKKKYLHIGLIKIKITGLFRTGIDTPIMIICCDERILNPLNSILGGAKSNLANRIFGVNIHPEQRL